MNSNSFFSGVIFIDIFVGWPGALLYGQCQRKNGAHSSPNRCM